MRKKKETNQKKLLDTTGRMVEIIQRASDPEYYFSDSGFDAKSFRVMVSSLKDLADAAERLSDHDAGQIVVELGEAESYAE